jgi:hypothetical protein
MGDRIDGPSNKTEAPNAERDRERLELFRQLNGAGHDAASLDCRIRGMRVPCSMREAASREVERLRATIARIREICAVEYDTASDLRADILAELGEP